MPELPEVETVVNMVRRPTLRPSELTAAAKGRLDAGEVAAGLKAAGLPSRPGVVEALLSEAADLAERAALERRERRALSGLGRPTYTLPFLPDGVDVGGLYELAGAILEQGVPQ